MEKSLLKITFKEPLKFYQDGIFGKCNFVVTDNVLRNKHGVSVMSELWQNSFPYRLIKSIEFIQPTDLECKSSNGAKAG